MRSSRGELQKIVAVASDHHALIALGGRKNVFIRSGSRQKISQPDKSCPCRSRASLTAAGTSWSRRNFTSRVLRFVGGPIARFQLDDLRSKRGTRKFALGSDQETHRESRPHPDQEESRQRHRAHRFVCLRSVGFRCKPPRSSRCSDSSLRFP